MLKELYHLIIYKLKSNFKLTIDLSLQGLIKNFGSFFLYSTFVVGTYYFTYNSIHYLLNHAHIGEYLLHKFLSILLFVFFLSVHIGNVVVSYSTFYKSREVFYLFTQPVNYLNVFFLKFLDNFFYSSTTLLLIGIAVIYGYGSYFALPLSFYPTVVLFVFFPFLFIAAALATIVLFSIIKLVQKYRLRTILIFFILLYICILYFYFDASNPYKIVEDTFAYYSGKGSSFNLIEPVAIKFLPNYWVSEYLYFTLKKNKVMSYSYLIVIIVTCIILLLLIGYLAKIFYRKSFLILQEIGSQPNQNKSDSIFRRKIFFNKQTDVIFKKELLTFFREPSQWIQLMIMLLFMLIFSFSVMNYQPKTSDPFLRTVSYVAIFVFVNFLIASLSLRFVFPAISLEYKNFWKIKSAPIKMNLFYNTKLIYYGVPTILIAVVLLAFSHFPFLKDNFLFNFSAYSVILSTIVLVILNFAGGSFFASFNEKSPVRIASTQAASLIFLLSLIYLGINSLIVAISSFKYFEALKTNTNFDTSVSFSLLLIFSIISILFVLVAYKIGLKVLKSHDFCN